MEILQFTKQRSVKCCHMRSQIVTPIVSKATNILNWPKNDMELYLHYSRYYYVISSVSAIDHSKFQALTKKCLSNGAANLSNHAPLNVFKQSITVFLFAFQKTKNPFLQQQKYVKEKSLGQTAFKSELFIKILKWLYKWQIKIQKVSRSLST